LRPNEGKTFADGKSGKIKTITDVSVWEEDFLGSKKISHFSREKVGGGLPGKLQLKAPTADRQIPRNHSLVKSSFQSGTAKPKQREKQPGKEGYKGQIQTVWGLFTELEQHNIAGSRNRKDTKRGQDLQ